MRQLAVPIQCRKLVSAKIVHSGAIVTEDRVPSESAVSSYREVPHRTLLMAAIMAATTMQFLDATIANVAIPRMQVGLGASMDTVNWVLTSFIIATAVTLPTAGWVSGRFGIRRTYMAALAGFILSSMLCGIAANLGQMVAFRILQGASAAFIAPLAQAIMLDITPTKDHVRVLGLWGMASMLGPIIGPTLGGYLTEELNWRWIFYINIPICIPTLAVLWRYLPSSPLHPRPLDRFGYVTIAIGLCAFQLLLDRGQRADWFRSDEIVIEATIAACAFWMFAVHTAYAKNPLFPRDLFHNPTFFLALFLTTFVGLVSVSSAALLPGLFENVYGYSVSLTGMLMAPRGIGLLISMWLVPRIGRHVPQNIMLGVGFAITAISIDLACGWNLDMDTWPLIISAFVQGLGLGLTMVPISMMAFNSVSASLRTDVAGMSNLFRALGGSIGVSVFTTMLTRSVQTSHAVLSANLSEPRLRLLAPAVFNGFGEGDLTRTMKMLDAEVNRQAMMLAYTHVFSVMLILALVTALVSALVKSGPR